MTRSISTMRFLPRAGTVCAVLTLFATACQEEGTPYGVNKGAARFSLNASSNAPGETMSVNVAYQRQGGTTVPMSTQSIPISTAGNQLVTVPLDLTDCLLDAERVVPRANTCAVVATVILRNQVGAPLDSAVVGPVAVAVGSAETFPSATLRATGSVRIAPLTPLYVGERSTPSVVVRDRENATIAGRAVSWSTSNAAVASVTAAGELVAISPGTARLLAVSQGIADTATATVLPNLAITNRVPADAAFGVSIESNIRITFSENIDAATVSAASLRLSQNNVEVPYSSTVNANVLTITPNTLLTEYSTLYLLTIGTALRSVSGSHLQVNTTTFFTTAFWDPNYTYRLVNNLRPGESLDVLANTSTCFMVATSSALSQAFYFLPYGDGAYSTFANVVSGSTKGMEGAVAPTRCFMFGPPFVPGQFTGLLWRAVAVAGVQGRYYMQNFNFGLGRSLDITPDSSGAFAPRMLPTANVPGQFWSFVRLGRR